MTLKEKVAEKEPANINDNTWLGGVIGCPGDYPYLHVPDISSNCNKSGEGKCGWCWNREFVFIKSKNRPLELYAIEEVTTGNIYFNTRGGCYRSYDDAMKKIEKLKRKYKQEYRIVSYLLMGE